MKIKSKKAVKICNISEAHRVKSSVKRKKKKKRNTWTLPESWNVFLKIGPYTSWLCLIIRTVVWNPVFPTILPIVDGRRNGFVTIPRVLVQIEWKKLLVEFNLTLKSNKKIKQWLTYQINLKIGKWTNQNMFKLKDFNTNSFGHKIMAIYHLKTYFLKIVVFTSEYQNIMTLFYW